MLTPDGVVRLGRRGEDGAALSRSIYDMAVLPGCRAGHHGGEFDLLTLAEGGADTAICGWKRIPFSLAAESGPSGSAARNLICWSC